VLIEVNGTDDCQQARDASVGLLDRLESCQLIQGCVGLLPCNDLGVHLLVGCREALEPCLVAVPGVLERSLQVGLALVVHYLQCSALGAARDDRDFGSGEQEEESEQDVLSSLPVGVPVAAGR
jgi:hypothetical protein